MTGRDSSWNRRYPPLLGIVVVLVIALAVLPSVLTLPQTHPSTTLEYAPVPPGGRDRPPAGGDLSSLGSTTSGTLGAGAGGAAGGTGGEPSVNIGGANGCWRMAEGGRRYLTSTWPSRDVVARKGTPATDPCNGFNGVYVITF